MNATEIKAGKQYLVRINWNQEGTVTCVQPKAEKIYNTWNHKVTVTRLKGSRWVPSTMSYPGRHEDFEETYDPPKEMLLDSHSFQFPLDENGEKIMTTAYLRKQNQQVEKLLAEQKKQEDVQEFIMNMALAGVECWQAKAHEPGTYYGIKKNVICFNLDDYQKLNGFVGTNLDDFLIRISGSDEVTDRKEV